MLLSKQKCKYCGDEFEQKRKHHIYCSKLCRDRLNKEQNKEEINRRKREIYAERIARENKKHKDLIRFGGNREKVLIRDNNSCQECGTDKDLVVHHIDKSGQRKNPNNEMDNLITLCRTCHAMIHTRGGKVETTCIYCNKTFIADRHDVSKGKNKYCSKECCDKDKIGKFKTAYNTTCQLCGKQMLTSPGKIAQGRGKYCSKECSAKSQTKTVDVVCQWCGKGFQTIPAKIKQGRGKFCSQQCAGKSKRQKQLEGSR